MHVIRNYNVNFIRIIKNKSNIERKSMISRRIEEMSNSTIDDLTKRKLQLEQILIQLNNASSELSNEQIQFGKRGNKYQYYRVNKTDNGKQIRTYIHEADYDVARNIAQANYNNRLKKQTIEELRCLDDLLTKYDPDKVNNIYSNLHPARKRLVKPLIMSDDEYAQIWRAKKSDIFNTYPINTGIFTERNEEVRSKTEKFIADKLNQLDIPYKYEYPLFAKDKTLFPDFTILKKRTRSIVYWEHLGKIDSQQYIDDNREKIFIYEKNGIFVGKNLILTFESGGRVLPTKVIEEIIFESILGK